MGRTTNKILLGIIIGAAIGVAFAPKKGSELRQELADDIKDGGLGQDVLRENAVVMGKDIAFTAKEVYSDPKVQAHIKRGKKEAQKLLEVARKNIEENGSEWVEIARDKIMEAKKKVEKNGADLIIKSKKSR